MTRDPVRQRRRFHHRAGYQPDVRRTRRAVVGGGVAASWDRPTNCAWSSSDPGRGTMMSDALRATKVVPAFREATNGSSGGDEPGATRTPGRRADRFRLSGRLASKPRRRAGGPGNRPRQRVHRCPGPVNQAVKQEDGWHERQVGIGEDAGKYAFTVAAEPIAHFERTLPVTVRSAANGAIFEWRPEYAVLDLCRRLKRNGGGGTPDRLRPCGRAPPATRSRPCARTLRRSPGGAGRGRPHLARGFRGARRRPPTASGRACTDRSPRPTS